MSSIILTANRKYPSIPEVGSTIESHTRVLEAIVESIQIHERRAGDVLDSFVSIRELKGAGIVDVNGNLLTYTP